MCQARAEVIKQSSDPCTLILWLSKKLKRSVHRELTALCAAHRLYLILNEGVCPCVKEVFTGADKEMRWAEKCCKLTYLFGVLRVVQKAAADLEIVTCEYASRREDGSCRIRRRQKTRADCRKVKAEITKNDGDCSWFSRAQAWWEERNAQARWEHARVAREKYAEHAERLRTLGL